MGPEDFAHFYEAVHGHPPFGWQVRLLNQVATEGWPQTINLPTSSGKTSAIDVAVFHLALEAESSNRRAPLRTFFIIDRRVVVDEAAEHAVKIATALLDPKIPIIAEVAERLKSFGGELPLGVSVLRGGMYRDSTWADEPNQPLVCVSTVDQVGSRLLFRGYQVGENSRPVHAALVANDSLLIVDEAHLSKAFLDTLEAVNGRYAFRDRHIARGMTVVQMSATVDAAHVPFQLEESDLASPKLLARYQASKRAELRAPDKKFEDAASKAAKELASDDGVHIVGVVVNTVGSARAIYNELAGKQKSEAVLLIGRNRPFCSKRLWDKYKPRIEANEERRVDGTLFVVATQTVEVGANFDFDALVTESAALDALRQRFGRLDRLGRRKKSKAVIVRRPGEDPIYGDATKTTWDFLSGIPDLDFGVLAMGETLKGIDPQSFNAKRSSAPLMFPAHLEFWVQTSPTPVPDPDVAPFLHGPEALDSADVQIVWRADLPEDVEDWEERVSIAPPHSTEALGLPIGVVRRWLKRDASSVNVTDLEGVRQPDEESERPSRETRPVLIWHSPDSRRNSIDAKLIRPGNTIIVRSSEGGCDEFGWSPDSMVPVDDVGDSANNELATQGLRSFRARIALLGAPKELIDRAVRNDDDADPDEEAQEELARLAKAGRGWRFDAADGLITWPSEGQMKKRWRALPDETDEDDSSSVGREQRSIKLDKHTEGVVLRAKKYAGRCGLSSVLAEDIALAAFLHDLGKWDERFQAWLHDGSWVLAARDAAAPLAKSGGLKNAAERRRTREQAKYPKNARHEMASVMLACASGLLAGAHDRELVLHLIGTHHGSGRPLFPVWDDDENVVVQALVNDQTIESSTGRELARIDSRWIDRFWSLNQAYGYWGLAYLETILRRADCMQSRKEQQNG
jgi:CRISPR-associated endonuclease/helicase Cas3